MIRGVIIALIIGLIAGIILKKIINVDDPKNSKYILIAAALVGLISVAINKIFFN